MDKKRGVRKSERISKTWVTILNGKKTFSLIFPLFPKFGVALKLLYIKLFPLYWMWFPCSKLTKSNNWTRQTCATLYCSNQICRSCVLFWNIWVHSHFIVSSCTSSVRSAVNCFVDCCLFSLPRCHKKILCWARLLAVRTMGCRNNGLSE